MYTPWYINKIFLSTLMFNASKITQVSEDVINIHVRVSIEPKIQMNSKIVHSASGHL
jgi:hypothetical protein